MDVPDIFFQICVHLEDEALSKLVIPRFWSTLKQLLQSDNFWYRRTEYIAKRALAHRPDIEWKRVYYTLLATMRWQQHHNALPSETVWQNMDYVPSLLVLEEVYSKPEWDSEDISLVWKNIQSVEVLSYLLKKKYIETDSDNILTCLHSACRQGREALVKKLLMMLDDQIEKEDLSFDELSDLKLSEQRCATDAIEGGHLNILKLILKRSHTEGDEEMELLSRALDGPSEEILSYVWDLGYNYDINSVVQLAIDNNSKLFYFILPELELDDEQKKVVLRSAILEGASNVIKTLLDSGIELLFNSNMLHNAVERGQKAFVQYILDRDKEVEITSDMLEEGMHQGPDMLAILLRDPRSDPMLIVDNVADVEIRRREIVKLLLEDERTEVEKLRSSTVGVMIHALGNSLSHKYEGARIALLEVGTSLSRIPTREKIIEKAKASGTYSLVLSFILLKKPTRQELVKWMIKIRNRELQLVAQEVVAEVNKEGEEAMPPDIKLSWARALMWRMLYPGLTLSDIISDLRDEGITQLEMDRVALLLGLYLGGEAIASEIEKR